LLAENCEVTIGFDGVAIIVHKNNPHQNFTLDQLKGIFSGETGRWEALGKAADGRLYTGSVRVYWRGDDSGTTKIVEEKVFAGSGYSFDNSHAALTKIEDNQGVSDRVAADPTGIGYVGRQIIEPSRAITVEGIAVSDATVRSKNYPLARDLYLYTRRGDASKTLTEDLVRFATSEAGQKIVARNGFLNLFLPPAASIPANELQPGPPEYNALIKGGWKRHQITFRFDFNSTLPNNLVRRDIPRLIENLEELSGNKNLISIRLLGFSDRVGPDQAKRTISDERARAIAQGLGDFLAQHPFQSLNVCPAEGWADRVAVPGTGPGQDQAENRRVEVWFRSGQSCRTQQP
jgi:phosphate transport system substrate-binding protein